MNLINTLCIADLHLEHTPLTEYRWNVFRWVKQVKGIETLIILGDLTEKKDNHNSKLVNRLVSELSDLPFEVIILKGNHDYYDDAFFRFLSKLENITFIDEPKLIGDMLFLPHSKTIDIERNIIERSKFIFLHHAFKGSRLMNDFILDEGIDPGVFDCDATIFSGHIHRAGKIGKITYVGSPYPVYFGDNDYRGRAIKLNGEIVRFTDTISRWGLSLENPGDIKNIPLKTDDQVKLKIKLDHSEYFLWEDIKKELREYINEKKAILVSLEMIPNKHKNKEQHGVEELEEDDLSIFERFCNEEKLEYHLVKIGKDLINEHN